MSIRNASTGRLRMRPPSLAALLALLAGLGVTSILLHDMREAEFQRARVEFNRRVEVRGAVVRRSFANASEVLRAANALFVSMETVQRTQFGQFVRPLLDGHGYIPAVVYHRIVEDAGRAAYESERAGVRPGFSLRERRGDTLTPAATRPRYLAVDYVEPATGNEKLLGYDALSYPRQARAFERALDSGQPASTELIPLLQDTRRVGIVLIQPVYRPGALLLGAAARREAVIGDTAVTVDVADLVGDSLAGARLLGRDGLTLALYGPIDGGHELAYRYEGVGPDRRPAWLRWLGTRDITGIDRFEVAGQPWELRFSARATQAADAPVLLVTALFGILASLSLAFYVQGRVTRARRTEALVRRRTADLRGALDALRLYRRAIDSSANAVLLISATRPDYPVEYVNPAFERMRGYMADEIVGHSLYELGLREPDQAAVAEIRAAIRQRRPGHVTMRVVCKDGHFLHAEVYVAPVVDAAGTIEHVVMTQYDITMAKRYEAELEARARFDTLTGLANRALLHDRIEGAINFTSGQAPVWVAALDLDHFKFVNDTLGHVAGDRLLQLVAARIAGAVGRSDTVARTGGDEFVLVLQGRATEGEVSDTVLAVLAALAHPLELEGQQLILTGSAGVAAFPSDGSDAVTLIQHAEVAMYRAKESGRNAVQFYTPSMNARARERLALEVALRGALSHEQFELYYQPQVDLASGSVVGVEALIRWRHPSLGMVRPDRFIRLAEETGLIVPIGAWVLRTACHQSRAWQRAGHAPLRIGVNLSARQFADPGLASQIAHVLDETGVAPSCLEVEITESLVMEDVEGAIRTMAELKRMGLKLSIDDFGTGYSSLSYLRRFPVDVLKIDRSFVRDIAFSEADAAMVTAIIDLARGLRMRTIAEGVETEAQLDYLKRRGCDEVQGHVYGRAVPGADLEAMLSGNRFMQPHDATA